VCGMCGVVLSDPNRPVDAGVVTRMRGTMRHRGLDDEGLITQPDTGARPATSASGSRGAHDLVPGTTEIQRDLDRLLEYYNLER
jgi:asparagine synthetase B (glutamine-hydrolysing)